MKKLILIATVVLSIIGCSPSGEPDVSSEDKTNIERLHKDGIGKVMAEDAAKKGQKSGGLANPDGGPGPAGQAP